MEPGCTPHIGAHIGPTWVPYRLLAAAHLPIMPARAPGSIKRKNEQYCLETLIYRLYIFDFSGWGSGLHFLPSISAHVPDRTCKFSWDSIVRPDKRRWAVLS